MSQNKRQTIGEYLSFIENKGIEKGYFEVFALKDIGKSCCLNATTKFIDFDETKKKLVKKSELVTPKSCDCLKIRPEHHCIDLIEIKGFVGV